MNFVRFPRLPPDALAGYILEEQIAYLIRNTGYRLLTDERQDPRGLKNEWNGLNVIGRGALHQVDVLGELSWIPAFTFPLRLIIEAKCRKAKTGIDVTRAMLATLIDVNQHNFVNGAAGERAPPRSKYTYVGAVFSASGFSSRAADLALAHAISLVDLNTPEFLPLVDAARASARALVEMDGSGELQRRPLERGLSPERFIRGVRTLIRLRLGTFPEGLSPDEPHEARISSRAIDIATGAARSVGELFVGMASGPYLLLLKADNREAFLSYSQKFPTHDVSIHWTPAEDQGRRWTIVPIAKRDAYRLTFRLPQEIAAWIFGSQSATATALDMKRNFFSNITIYRHEANRDSLIRLKYRPWNVERDR